MGRRRAKHPRLKRAWAKPFQIKNVTGANTAVLKEYNDRIDSIRCGAELPKTLMISAEVLATQLRVQWQTIFHQGMDAFNYVVLEPGRRRELRLYFCGKDAFFVERCGDAYRRSMIYGSVEDAKMRWSIKRIQWVETGEVDV